MPTSRHLVHVPLDDVCVRPRHATRCDDRPVVLVVANYARVAQPFLICFEATPKLALAPLIVLILGIGLASKVAIGVALTVVVTTLTTFSAVRLRRSRIPRN